MPPAPPVLCCWRYLPPGQQRKQLPRPQRSAFTSPFSVMAKDRHRVPFNATLYPSLGSQPSLASLLKTLRARRPTCPAPALYKSRHPKPSTCRNPSPPTQAARESPCKQPEEDAVPVPQPAGTCQPVPAPLSRALCPVPSVLSHPPTLGFPLRMGRSPSLSPALAVLPAISAPHQHEHVAGLSVPLQSGWQCVATPAG